MPRWRQTISRVSTLIGNSAAAVPADLVRLSCGIESPRDLVAELLSALG